MVDKGALSAGHVRPLLTMEDQLQAAELARTAVREGWSVRRMEEMVKKGRGAVKKEGRKTQPPDPILQALEEEMRGALGTRVALKRGRKGKGVIEIPFLNPEDFERVFLLLTGKEVSEVVE